MEPESDLVATREMVMNLLEATWETAESMSSQSSSSDSSSSSDDDEAAVAQSTSDRQYAIAHLTELLQLVQRRTKARDSAAAAATLHPAAVSLTATPSKSLRPCWSHSDVPSMALAEESSFETVARMRRSYQVQAVACHSSSSFDINRESPTGDVCSLLDQVSDATIINSRAIYNDACVVCGLSDKGSYTKMGFKCHNCIPLVDVVDSPLYMRYNPSVGEALFADTATGSGLLTRTSSGTVVRTPSLQRRITYQQGSVLSGSSQRLSLSTSNRPRSPSVGSINSITAGGGNSSKNRFLSRSDFSESHQDPTNFQMTEIEREVGAIEGALKAHYRNRCVHPLNGGMIIEEVGGDGQPSGGPPSKVKNVSFEGLPTFLQIQSVAGDGDQGEEGVPARHMHSEWESTWDNPVRGNDFIRSIPCVRLTNQYDQYGLSFLRCYQSEAERSTRLVASKPTSADIRDAFLSLFRNCSTGSVFVSPSSPAPSPKTLKADAKRDPQSWSTSMYTHVVPHLFTEASPGDIEVPAGRMGRYMIVKRSGLCATALSNDTLLEGSPLLSSMLLGTSQRPTPTAVNGNSGGSRSSFPPTTTAATTATPIHDLHGLVHPNLLYIFAVAPHAASNSTWYVLENLPSLMDYRIVKQRLSNTLSTSTAAATSGHHSHHNCNQDTSPLDNKRAPPSTHKLGRLRSVVSNVIVKRHASSLSSGTTSFRNAVQTVMSHIISKSADEEFKALAFGSISAIQAIHKAGFVHGDLRPHNFFVDPTTGSVKIRFCPSYERLPSPFCPPEATVAAATAPFKPTPEGDIYTLGITLRLLRFGTADESGYPPQDIMLEGDRQLIIMLQSMTDPVPSARPSPASLLETGPLWVVRTVEGIPAVRKHLSMSILSYHDQLTYATAQFKRMGQGSPQSSFALAVSSRSNSPSFPTALAAEPTKEFKMPTESRLYLRDSTVSTTTFDTSPLVDDDTDAHSAMQDSFNKSFGGSFANLSAYRRISSQRGLAQGKSESMGNSPSLGVSMDESTQDEAGCAILTNQLQQVVLPLSALSTLAAVPTHSSSSNGGDGPWYQDPAAVAGAPVFILRNVGSKGAQELLKFFAVCGPSYHAVRGRDGFLSLYSVAKDPRVSKE